MANLSAQYVDEEFLRQLKQRRRKINSKSIKKPAFTFEDNKRLDDF